MFSIKAKILLTMIVLLVSTLAAAQSSNQTDSAVAPSNVTATGPTNITANVTNNATTIITVTNTTNVTQPYPSAPGFEGIFAITGLLAAAYLVFGRKR